MTFFRVLESYLLLITREPTANRAMVLSGLLGFLGALIMFFGDLLLYAHWRDMPVVSETILSLLPGRKAVLLATSGQLQISGVLGPIAGVFYLFGAWHLYIKLAFYSRFWAVLTNMFRPHELRATLCSGGSVLFHDCSVFGFESSFSASPY